MVSGHVKTQLIAHDKEVQKFMFSAENPEFFLNKAHECSLLKLNICNNVALVKENI